MAKVENKEAINIGKKSLPRNAKTKVIRYSPRSRTTPIIAKIRCAFFILASVLMQAVKNVLLIKIPDGELEGTGACHPER